MHNIVLTSKTVGSTSPSLRHGIFPSYEAAVKYIIRENSNITDPEKTAMLGSASSWDKEDPKCKEWDVFIPTESGHKHHWLAALQPLRDEEGN